MVCPFKTSRLSAAVGAALAMGVVCANAQVTTPDAGSLSTTPMAPPAALPASNLNFDIQQQMKPALVAPGGVKVKVNNFTFSGNTVFPSSVLTDLLRDKVGKDLDLAGLDEAATIVSQYYRQQGYFVARAYLPAQEVASGNIEISVIEGRLGKVKLEREGESRLQESVALGIIGAAAPAHQAIREQNVERGLLLLNDLPSVEVRSTLVPGATPGSSDLIVTAKEGAMAGFSIDADNYGNKYTGSVRVGGTIIANDVSGNGDSVNVRYMTTGENMKYGRLAYNTPIGNDGLKAGVAYSNMRYKLGKDFVALNANGRSDVLSLNAAYPIVRSRNENLYLSGGFDSKQLSDNQLGVAVANKHIRVATLGLSGDQRDNYAGGGMTSGGLTFAQGQLDLAGNVNYAANDALTAKSAGSYTKVNYNVSRLQRLDDAWSLYLAFSGQISQKNMDSSEKFVLGGMGVRAYPQGEAAGDAGNLLNAEVRYNLSAGDFGLMQLVGFIDTGRVQLHHRTWTGWQPVGRPNFPNNYTLSGAGIGLNVYKENDYTVRTSVAWKVGNNPGADVLGRDSDGTDRSARLWLQLSKQF